MTKVLVTGGAGFIGSHVAELCQQRGFEVVVLDDFSQGKREWIPAGSTIIEGSVTDLALVRKAMVGIDGVFHLAAMSRVLPSLQGGPEACLSSAEPNIMGTINVMIAAAEAKVKKFVYSASSTYYGNTPAPHIETGPLGAETPYAVSKYIGELYASRFSVMYGLPTVCLRYFQVYGPRCPSTGTYAMVSSIFIEQARKGEALTVHGDGSQRRDFVHVKDVAEANVRAFESNLTNDVINVGTGVSHSIKELADLISPNQIFGPARQLDMAETRADMTRCQTLLGWVPQIGFTEGTMALKTAHETVEKMFGPTETK